METFSGWVAKKLERFKESPFPSESGKEIEKQRERSFLDNGSKLLEELITSCKGKCRCNPIRSFSAKQVLDATQCFKSRLRTDGWCKWYKGILDGHPVLIKTYESLPNEPSPSRVFRDIAISSHMSSHKNALKLLGCCLEFVAPVLVYEDAKNGVLSQSGDEDSNGLSLSWKTRLRIARDVANAITYLHTALHRPIIHRNIKPRNIFLDENYVPKLSNFDLCIAIPEGETQVEDSYLVGTYGFMDPVYCETYCVSEHTDVYSFGVFLLVLLTGQNPIDRNRNEEVEHISNYIENLVLDGRFDEVVDRKIWEQEGGIIREKKQLLAFKKLAFSCIQREDRPPMIDVAKELIKIARSADITSTG